MEKKDNHYYIGKCLDRYSLFKLLPASRITCFMDLHFSNVNAKELYETDIGTFFHDMNGIFTHMNRETKELGDCFVPRVGLLPSKEVA